MVYQKIMYLLDNKPNQPSKFRVKNCVEINDDLRGIYDTNSQIKFKTSTLKSVLCHYIVAYIFTKRTMTIAILTSRR